MQRRPRRHASILLLVALPCLLLASAAWPGRLHGGSPLTLEPDPIPAEPRAESWSYLANTNRITALALDPEKGEIWAGSRAGVVRWTIESGTGRHYTTEDGLPSNDVRAVAIVGSEVWLGTAKGLSRLQAEEWTTFRVGNGLVHDDVQTLEVGPDGALWAGTWGGLSVRAPDGSWRSYTRASTDGRLPSDHVIALAIGERDRWIGTWNGGLARWWQEDGQERWRTYETDSMEADGHTLVSDNVAALAVDPSSGDLWAAAAGRWDPDLQLYFPGALSRMTPDGRWSLFDRERDLLSESIHELEVTEEGVLWIASEGGASSIEIAASATFTHITSDQKGLLDDRVSALEIGPSGTLYFGTGKGISVLEPNGRWSPLTREADLPDNHVNALALDERRQRVWLGTREGVARLDLGTGDMAELHPSGGSYANWVNDIALEADETAWLATGLYDPTFRASQSYRGGGVVRIDPDGKQTRYTQARPGEPGLSHDLVFAAAIDQDGGRWFGTWQGLSRMTAGDEWLPAIRAPKAVLRVDEEEEHPAWEGMIGRPLASFGLEGVAGELALHGHACYHTFETPVEDVRGKIALVEQGNCWSSDNLETAERNGAIGVLVYAAQGRDPRRMEGNDRGIDVPGAMIDRELGLRLRARREAGETVRVRMAAADPAAGLVSDDVRAIAHVEDGAWLGTWGGGAAFVDAQERIVSYTTASTHGGLTDDRVLSVAEAPDGTVWFGTDRGGISRRTPDGRWLDPLPVAWTDGGAGDRITALAFDEQGVAWIGTSGRDDPDEGLWQRGGLAWRAPDGAWGELRSEDGLPDDDALSLALGAEGRLVIGTRSGAYLRDWKTNGRCEDAKPIANEAHVTAVLRHPADRHYFRFRVDDPHAKAEISVTASGGEIAIRLFRSCRTIDSDSGRKIAPGDGDLAPGQTRIVRDLGTATGDFYIEVSRTDDEDVPVDSSLQLDVTQVQPDSVRTLVLTDIEALSRAFPNDPIGASTLAGHLQALAEDPHVRGRLVLDLGEELGGAYARWLRAPGGTEDALAAAAELRSWIWRQHAALPHLRYLVLVGDDRIVPHHRLHVPGPDDGHWASEADYLVGGMAGTIPRGASIRPALEQDLTLGDDYYAAATASPWDAEQGPQAPEIYVPELAVGRLVESPSQILRVVDAFLAQRPDGMGEREPRTIGSSLVAGWDFMSDGPEEGARLLERAGHPGEVARLLGDRWTADELGARLGERRVDLAFLGMHANHFSYEAPFGSLRAETLRDASVDASGALAYSLACHGGLSVPGQHADGTGEAIDLPEAWLGAGAQYLSSTGWAYGMQGALGYQEALMVDFTGAIADGQGTAVGDALLIAKQGYAQAHEMNAFHAKTLVGTILYGLPMASYRLGELERRIFLPQVRRDARGGGAGSLRAPDPEPAARGPSSSSDEATAGPQAAPRPRLSETRRLDTERGELWRQSIAYEELGDKLVRHDGARGSYYTVGDQRPYAEHGRSVQPKLSQSIGSVRAGGGDHPVRGVLLRAAEYRSVPLPDPVVALAGLLGTKLEAPEPDAPGQWAPSSLVRMRALRPGHDGRDPMLLVYLGQYHGHRQRQRLYDRIEIGLFASDHPDRKPPRIHAVSSAATAEGLEIALAAEDESGLAVANALCDDGVGRWTTIELEPLADSGLYQGLAPLGSACIAQVADGAGNTALDDRAGRLHDGTP